MGQAFHCRPSPTLSYHFFLYTYIQKQRYGSRRTGLHGTSRRSDWHPASPPRRRRRCCVPVCRGRSAGGAVTRGGLVETTRPASKQSLILVATSAHLAIGSPAWTPSIIRLVCQKQLRRRRCTAHWPSPKIRRALEPSRDPPRKYTRTHRTRACVHARVRLALFLPPRAAYLYGPAAAKLAPARQVRSSSQQQQLDVESSEQGRRRAKPIEGGRAAVSGGWTDGQGGRYVRMHLYI